ncbi:hypothetical protein KFK09_003117 [Dendrobium nobile]|uniref:Uncharacterized protein n=1 Tax=Dendrobium nobile TaxID=94219 RepID=A0A8T3C3L0_DENNO|nr:hypothetical protein KFK09_003117 [Dendrobium nobile]
MIDTISSILLSSACFMESSPFNVFSYYVRRNFCLEISNSSNVLLLIFFTCFFFASFY